LEVGLRPSKLVWGGYFAGFRLLVNGISDNCRCVISDEPSALAALLMKASAAHSVHPPNEPKKNTRFFDKVRAVFNEIFLVDFSNNITVKVSNVTPKIGTDFVVFFITSSASEE
jgi:hypothetical protein